MRNVRIAAVVDENTPRGYGDKVQLQQVILNLLLNAFDAVKDVPEPERSVTSVRCREPDMLTISVSDCGSGIPPEKLGEIFQPFYTTKTEGLGIGLSISRSIIAAHGGRLDVEPNPGRGVTFYFTIPVAREEELPQQVSVNG